MIDASKITAYNLSHAELEERIIFWILAAGKNGTRAAEITNDMVAFWKELVQLTPFGALNLYTLGGLEKACEYWKTGCHTHKARSLYEISHSGIDLKTCSAEDLETIYGIGMKTARCFIIHSRENAEYAGLDTHMLKHLASLGHDVPKSTPSRKKYLTLENIVIKLSDEAGITPAEYDLAVWNKYKII